MEQAVNQFNKGLQQDVNPMVQGSDVLSDALNATFITMNGNEVILQNDMGNRRIDNAYLPSGYTPVGIKEYGGIIYIAAYNPITNKSQIGSFPSPERKISSNDDSSLGNVLNLNDLTTTYMDPNLVGLSCIKTDTILIPLTDKNSLHAGDKFVVYGDLSEFKDDITNYQNVVKSKVANSSIVKVYSPKNKKYTLALGILNSQNEFVDITKTLVRWNRMKLTTSTNILGETKTIEKEDTSQYDDTISDLYKFNDGYFISKFFTEPTLSETTNNTKLIQERQAIATNTYAYKLVGPLYLQAKLNHIKEFSYNIYGVYNTEELSATLWVEAYITYNCPDGITQVTTVNDPDYYTYEEGTIKPYAYKTQDSSTWEGIKNELIQIPVIGIEKNNKSTSNILEDATSTVSTTNNEEVLSIAKKVKSPIFEIFPITIENGKEGLNGGTPLEETTMIATTSTYNKETNLYTCKITKQFDNVQPTSKKIFNYIVGVRSVLGNNENVSYLSGLSTRGSLDFSLLGSGTVVLSSWRFYNNYEKETTTLTYTLSAYPAYEHSFDNLIFTFTNVSDKNDIVTIKGTLYNGVNIINFDWPGFKKNALYRVTWEYKEIDNLNNGNVITHSSETTQQDRWFLTTELFNDCYFASSANFIKDWGNLSFDYNNLSEMKEAYRNALLSVGYSDADITSIDNKADELYKSELVKNWNEAYVQAIKQICINTESIIQEIFSSAYTETYGVENPDFISDLKGYIEKSEETFDTYYETYKNAVEDYYNKAWQEAFNKALEKYNSEHSTTFESFTEYKDEEGYISDLVNLDYWSDQLKNIKYSSEGQLLYEDPLTLVKGSIQTASQWQSYYKNRILKDMYKKCSLYTFSANLLNMPLAETIFETFDSIEGKEYVAEIYQTAVKTVIDNILSKKTLALYMGVTEAVANDDYDLLDTFANILQVPTYLTDDSDKTLIYQKFNIDADTTADEVKEKIKTYISNNKKSESEAKELLKKITSHIEKIYEKSYASADDFQLSRFSIWNKSVYDIYQTCLTSSGEVIDEAGVYMEIIHFILKAVAMYKDDYRVIYSVYNNPEESTFEQMKNDTELRILYIMSTKSEIEEAYTLVDEEYENIISIITNAENNYNETINAKINLLNNAETLLNERKNVNVDEGNSEEQKIFNSKLKVQYDVELGIKDYSKNLGVTSFPTFIAQNPANDHYLTITDEDGQTFWGTRCTQEHSLNIQLNPSIKRSLVESLYPSYVKVNDDPIFTKKIIGETEKTIYTDEVSGEYAKNIINENKHIIATVSLYNSSSNSIIGSILNYDFIYCKEITNDITIENYYDTLDRYLGRIRMMQALTTISDVEILPYQVSKNEHNLWFIYRKWDGTTLSDPSFSQRDYTIYDGEAWFNFDRLSIKHDELSYTVLEDVSSYINDLDTSQTVIFGESDSGIISFSSETSGVWGRILDENVSYGYGDDNIGARTPYRNNTWWKCTDGKWAIVAQNSNYDLINAFPFTLKDLNRSDGKDKQTFADSLQLQIRSNTNVSNIVAKVLPPNTIYAYLYKVSLKDLALTKLNGINGYAKNELYSKDIEIPFEFEISNAINISNPEGVTFYCNHPEFTVEDKKVEFSYTYKIDSYSNFEKLIQIAFQSTIFAYSRYGSYDSNGNDLSPDNFYQYDNGELKQIKTNFEIQTPIQIVDGNYTYNIRNLLYKPTKHYTTTNLLSKIQYPYIRTPQSVYGSKEYEKISWNQTIFVFQENYFEHIIFPYDVN